VAAVHRRLIVGGALCVVVLCGVSGAAGQRAERAREWMRLGTEVQGHFKEGDYEKAAAACRKMIELVPRHPSAHYNLACALARLGRKEEGLVALEGAVAKGFGKPAHMRQDPDLATLRDDPRFAACVAKAKENERTGGGAYEPGEAIEGVKTVEGSPEGGLRYRLRMSPDASAERPQRLIVWLHPAGGSANRRVEPMSRRLVKLGFALVVLTQKEWRFWSGSDMGKLLKVTLPAVAKTPGIDARRPVLMGYSAGGQAALTVWHADPGAFGGLILDAAYPVRRKAGGYAAVPLPEDPGVKGTPFFVLVGEKDGGAAFWRKVEPTWREAGVPLTVRYIPGKGHAWLFGAEQMSEIEGWLKELRSGKRPGG